MVWRGTSCGEVGGVESLVAGHRLREDGKGRWNGCLMLAIEPLARYVVG